VVGFEREPPAEFSRLLISVADAEATVAGLRAFSRG
jgi:hypothetical protein